MNSDFRIAMIGNYSALNRLYFALLLSGLIVLAIAIASVFAMPVFSFALLSAAAVLIMLGIICKVLVWYNVYSEVVTKEDFKKATASGSIFQKVSKARQKR